jgi:mRNA-degrading endonuclease RelE of RelBE toxin-antitoxin system
MSYEVLIHPRVAKAIRDLSKAHKVKLSEFIDALKDNLFLSGNLM